MASIFHLIGLIPFGFWLFFATIFLGWAALALWKEYVQKEFIAGIEFIVMEIIPPREVLRSPKAMELFFTNALYHATKKAGREEYWVGAVRFWFSLEIASIEGQVHFYVRTPSRLKELIETQMYAQYPQAQVKVVEDYTLAVDQISKDSEWNLWGCEFSLEKPDAYPIKTYVDFGLDKDPKEEYKIDPISPVIELFGSIKKGEQLWLQIVIMPSKKKYHHDGKSVDWVEEGHLVLEKLAKPYTRYHQAEEGKGGDRPREMRLPPWLDPVVDAINQKTLKLGFDTGIRLCYVAKKEVFNSNTAKNSRLIFRQYSNPYLNSLVRVNTVGAGSYGNLFLLSKEKTMKLATRFLEEYRERAFFYPSLEHKLFSKDKLPWPISPAFFLGHIHSHTFVLNVEELATLWHFPGQILKVPTLERIESKEASPPTNLPV